jgi:hypothetical protein
MGAPSAEADITRTGADSAEEGSSDGTSSLSD